MIQAAQIESLIRANIRELTPYRSARDDFHEGVLLDANENSYGSPIRHELALNRYPDPLQNELREAIADFRQVEKDHVFTGVGSDEPIDLLIRIFCEPGNDSILITPPTYGMYKVSANINNVNVQEVQLDETFQPDAGEILSRADDSVKLIFLCSPNNPTGNDYDRTEILKLLELFNGIVVVDEAYIDFSRQESMAGLIAQYPNLVVLQTLSKSFGLAGIRLGIALSSPLINRYLLRVKAPYNVNKLTAQAALEAFDYFDLVRINIEEIKKERERLAKGLGDIPAVETVFPSQANFLLFRIKNAHDVYRKLAEKGMIIRYRGDQPGCEECLRATVGLPDENDRLIRLIREVTK